MQVIIEVVIVVGVLLSIGAYLISTFGGSKKPVIKNRIGVYKPELYITRLKVKKDVDPVYFLEELEVNGKISKIKVLDVTPGHAKDLLIKYLGNYIETNKVDWTEEPVKEDPTLKTIKTPMSELVKAIEQDDIEGI